MPHCTPTAISRHFQSAQQHSWQYVTQNKLLTTNALVLVRTAASLLDTIVQKFLLPHVSLVNPGSRSTLRVQIPPSRFRAFPSRTRVSYWSKAPSSCLYLISVSTSIFKPLPELGNIQECQLFPWCFKKPLAISLLFIKIIKSG